MIHRQSNLTRALWPILALVAGVACIALALLPGPAQHDEAQGARAFDDGRLEHLFAISENESFGRPSGSWKLSLPSDHGDHPEMRSETWMIAAHLTDETGAPVGMNFSLSRLGLRAGPVGPESTPWDFRALYRAHVVLAMSAAQAPRAEERFSRGAGAAGGDRDAGEVWLDNWQLNYGKGPENRGLNLIASAEDASIDLDLSPVKAAIDTDADADAPLRSFAIPRLTVEGTIDYGDKKSTVAGVAWLDRLWGDLPMPGGPLAYERLIIQLGDGTDLSVLRTSRRDGRGQATVEGFMVTSTGQIETLPPDGVEMTALADWNSEDGSLAYPLGWRLVATGLELEISPLVETHTLGFEFPGWSGIVNVSGHHDGRPVEDLGTLQMTGYDVQ